jgi:hypothetical protein
MKGYGFDPARLACSPMQQERQGYAVAARLLRDYLGGDIFVQVRERGCRDPRLPAMLAEVAEMVATTGHDTPHVGGRRSRRPGRPR